MRKVSIKAGCCGLNIKGGARAYYELFDVVELQSTFYRLPRVETARIWRTEAPEGFEFVVKAWQTITHLSSSPTWRKIGPIPNGWDTGRCGHLRPTPENLEAWNQTLNICRFLDSKVCVIQSPPSFAKTGENIGNLREFFKRIPRGNVSIAWEPRHKTWHENPRAVKKLCTELHLIHVVDILKREPQSSGNISYIRLHGLPRELNYRYSYRDEDLKLLVERVLDLETGRLRPACNRKGKSKSVDRSTRENAVVYVLFNNLTASKDCIRFKELLGSERRVGRVHM